MGWRDTDTVQLSLDAAVALAGNTLQPLAIEDGDVPTVIADQPRGLEYPRGEGHRRPP
jgi:hypothetical protein